VSFVRCRECLYPTTKPSLHFVDGICAACVNFGRRDEIDWSERDKAFLAILDKLPKNDSGYDVIVPSSAGKDSSAQVHKLLELGARPLVVTASTCMLTDIGRKNIDNLARYATTIEVTPNREVRRKLNKIGMELVGDVSIPEHWSIFSTPFRIAADLGISTIVYGEAPTIEYGGPPGTEQACTMTRNWIAEHAGFIGLRATDMVGIEGICDADMREYMLPSDEKLAGVTAYWLGNYYPWSSHENAKVAIEHGMQAQLPCRASYWPAENLDCVLTGLHDHGMWRKFGYGRLCAQISIDIRNGLISRKDAYKIVRQRDGLFPYEYMGVPVEEACRHMDVTMDWLMATFDRFTHWELFSHVDDGRPILKEFAKAQEAA
jgi:N-acetyl sugar amidotransferase